MFLLSLVVLPEDLSVWLLAGLLPEDLSVWLLAGLLLGEGRVPSRITRGTERKVLGSKVSALGRKLAGFRDLSNCRWGTFA